MALASCLLGVVSLAMLVMGCGSTSTEVSTASKEGAGPPIDIVHEGCDVNAAGAVKIDVNNDGRADIIHVMQGNREVCRVLDLNFDGKVDNFLYFDEAGNLRRRESDFDRDGLIDEIGYYKNGQIVQKHRETSLNGKLDTWDTYVNGRLTERLRDTNANGRVDQWWTFPDPSRLDCPVIATDETGDGKPDTRYDPCKEREGEYAATAPAQPVPGATAPPPEDAGPGSENEGGS